MSAEAANGFTLPRGLVRFQVPEGVTRMLDSHRRQMAGKQLPQVVRKLQEDLAAMRRACERVRFRPMTRARPMKAPCQAPRRRRTRTRGSHQRPVRRTSGSRGDPPPEDPEPAPALRVAVTAPADSLDGGTFSDKTRLILYERHPVYGLVNRPLTRFLGGRS